MARVRRKLRLKSNNRNVRQPITPTKKGVTVVMVSDGEDEDSPSYGLPTPPDTPTNSESFDSITSNGPATLASSVALDTSTKSKPLKRLTLSPTERRSSRHSDPQAAVATIHVVENSGKSTEFVVSKYLITQHSRVLDRAFNGHFTEAIDQKMDWHDTDARTFQMMVTWIYTSDLQTETNTDPSADDLLRLWVLADKLLMPKLQNIIIRSLESMSAEELEYSTETFFCVYDSTPAGSQLRSYLCDYFTLAVDIELADPEEYPAEMLAELFMAARRMVRKKGGTFSNQRLKRYLVPEDMKVR